MIKGERVTLSGKRYQTKEAFANPRVRPAIPLLIGGSGEKKTFPLAARHFDHLNILAGFDELPHKVRVAKQCCEDIGRDPATLATTALVAALIGDGLSPDIVPEDLRNQAVAGNPEHVAEQIKTKVLDAGVDGVIVSPATQLGYAPGPIGSVGELLASL